MEREEDNDPLSDPEEARVLHAALDSFRQYRHAAHYNITHLRRQSFYSLRSAHLDVLSEPPFSLPQVFRDVDEAIDSNADIAEAILAVGLPSFGLDPEDTSYQGRATPNDMDKARQTIRQLYRDWSVGGAPERHACFRPIMDALEIHLGASVPADRWQRRVLVPGAGLGRLVMELCAAGYTVEGNEISYHQLLASFYMLNCTRLAGQHTLFPWALSFSNHLNRQNQLRSVSIPDVHPATYMEAAALDTQSKVHHSERMSVTAGDFCAVYRQAEYKDAFDAVVTCFFIDTAPNVIHYIEAVKHCLQPGGIWVNLGPLLWHFESRPTPVEREKQHSHGDTLSAAGERTKAATEGIEDPGSFELTDQEVIALVDRLGFDILEHKQTPAGATGYIQDPTSMLQNVYMPSSWTARKRQ